MTQVQVIRIVCSIVGLVYRSIGDYSQSSDGFCQSCPFSDTPHFRHAGQTLRYLLDAVVTKLKADGYTVARIELAETQELLK